AERKGEVFDPNKAYAYAATSGLVNVLMSKAKVDAALGPWMKAAGGTALATWAKALIRSTVTGAIANAAQGGIQDELATKFNIEERNPFDPEKRLQDVELGGLLGLGHSVITGGVHTLYTSTGEALKGRVQPKVEIINGKAPITNVSENTYDFVFPKEGITDWGEITSKMAKEASMSIQPAPIRIQMGTHDESGNGFGWVHVHDHEKFITNEGWRNVSDYVEHILQNFDQIWRQPNGRLMLVKENGKKQIAIVELQQRQGFYGLTTVYLDRPNKDLTRKGKLIWERSAPATAKYREPDTS
ncbi:MAG: hypothetical protein ABI254_02240, partial [Chthoniobacterales bacterium]